MPLIALGAGIMGNIADRSGNRFVLRLLDINQCLYPLTGGRDQSDAFGCRFILDYLRPYRTHHRCLPALSQTTHLKLPHKSGTPQYLGVMSLFQAIPLFVSPLVGALIETLAFEPVFISCSVLVLLGFLLTFKLAEPRFTDS